MLIPPPPFISIDTAYGYLIVPCSNRHINTSALEDTRHAILDDDFATIVLGSMDCTDSQVDELLSYGKLGSSTPNTEVKNSTSKYDADLILLAQITLQS